MVKIRLARAGRKKRPFYRILVTDSRSPRDSSFIERLGYYDPLPKQPIVKLDWQKALNWLEKGAQPTDTVRALLSKQGVMQLYDMKMHQGATPEQLDAALKAWMAKFPDRFAPAGEPEPSE